MGTDPATSYLLLFDGPAHEQRVETSVPPNEIRWFCQSPQMGSDDPIEWWSLEEPPEDDSVEITEYHLIGAAEEPEAEADGLTVLEYSCDDTRWSKTPSGDFAGLLDDLAQNPELLAKMTAPPPLTRSLFSAQDIRAVLIGDDWCDVPVGSEMREVLIEPDPGDPTKVSLGTSICFERDGKYLVIPPDSVKAFEFAASTVVSDDIQIDPDEKSLRMSRERYESKDEQLETAVAEAKFVEVIEPDGTQTIVKQPDAEQ